MIYFCGDIHGDFRHMINTVERDRPQAIVLLGDMECAVPLHTILDPICSMTDIWFIHGNHDTDQPESWKYLAGSELADRNLHGRVVDIAGVRIAGLGGVFREEIWLPPGPQKFASYVEFERKGGHGRAARASHGPEGNQLKHRSTIFPQAYDVLAKQHADILILHEAPECHPHGYRALGDLARLMRVKRLFHGHQHDNLDYALWSRSTGIQAHGVGLRGITNELGEVIVPGELDAARRYRSL